MRLTYANVTATAALFFALGGSSYAALKITSRDIANNTIASVDVRDSTLRSVDVRDGTLRSKDFKAGELLGTAGPRGAEGPAGVAGPAGPAGAAGVMSETLPSGRTLRGVFGVTGAGSHAFGLDAVTFTQPFQSPPTGFYLKPGQSAPNCPGTAANPEAAPGWVCVYAESTENVFDGDVHGAEGAHGNDGPTERFGFVIEITKDNPAGAYTANGTWAATAP